MKREEHFSATLILEMNRKIAGVITNVWKSKLCCSFRTMPNEPGSKHDFKPVI